MHRSLGNLVATMTTHSISCITTTTTTVCCCPQVGEKYTACAKQLDAALTKGTLRHEELGKIVQQAEQQISVSQVYVEVRIDT